jgi:hypothetical protein
MAFDDTQNIASLYPILVRHSALGREAFIGHEGFVSGSITGLGKGSFLKDHLVMGNRNGFKSDLMDELAKDLAVVQGELVLL